MSRRTCRFLLFLTATELMVSPASPASDVCKEEYLSMRRMVGQEQFTDAIARCKELIQKYPDYLYLYEALPEISLYAQDLDGASSFFVGRINEGTQLGLGYFGLGTSCFYKKDYKTAVLAFNRAIELGVSAAECFRNFEYSFEKLEGGESAIRYFTSLCHRNPENPGYWYALALAHWARFDFDKVESCINEALIRRPQDLKFREVQAIAMLFLRQTREGQRLINDLIARAEERGDLPSIELLRSHLTLQEIVSWGVDSLNRQTHEIIRLGTEFGLYKWLGWGYKRLADLENHQGDFENSLFYSHKAQAASKRADDRDLMIQCSNDIFLAHFEMGDLDQALTWALDELTLSKSKGFERQRTRSLTHVALVYHEMGENTLARDYCTEALMNAEARGADAGLFCQLHTALGLSYEGLQDNRAALFHHRLAVDFARSAHLTQSEAIALGNLGNSYMKSMRLSLAKSCFDQQLRLARKDHFLREEGYACLNLGNYYANQAKHKKALRSFSEGLNIGRKLNSKPIMLMSANALGQLFDEMGNKIEALNLYQLTVETGKSMGVSGSHTVEAKPWRADLMSAVDNATRILCTLGRTKEAFDLSDRTKMESSFSQIGLAQRRALRSIPDSVRARGLGLRSELENKREALATEIQRNSTARNPTRELHLRNEIAALELEYGEIVLGITKTDSSSIEWCELTRSGFTNNISSVPLSGQLAILEYSMGSKRTEAFLMKSDTLIRFEIKRSLKDLSRDIRELSLLFKSGAPNHQYWNSALASFDASTSHRLYATLIAPVERDLQGVTFIVIVPDGVLRSLPFDCLLLPSTSKSEESGFSSSNFLGQKFETVYSVAACMLNPQFRPIGSASDDILAVGSETQNSSAPDLDDPGVLFEESDQLGFSKLNGARVELRQIQGVFKGRMGARVEFDASKNLFKRLAPRFRILHIATHAESDDSQPLNSSLIFGDDLDRESGGRFRAFEFLNMDLNAELVVLSGCNTGRPSDRDGLNGLVSALFYAGVPSVISSLWSVDDESTAQLMGSFYKYLKQGERKSRALQLAKIDLIKSGRYDPFYWAGFILIGDPSPVDFSQLDSTDAMLRTSVYGLMTLLLFSVLMEASNHRFGKTRSH